ncbi:hypothetical protein G9A89_003558 [Geosiphon pyriformis]|nr:hypothetical protein G9A89_003558 [Geosiphon pyriformis]
MDPEAPESYHDEEENLIYLLEDEYLSDLDEFDFNPTEKEEIWDFQNLKNQIGTMIAEKEERKIYEHDVDEQIIVDQQACISQSQPICFKISEKNRSQISDLLQVFYTETYLTGDDEAIVAVIRSWCESNYLTCEELFSLLDDTIHNPKWACLKAFCHHYAFGTKGNFKYALRWYRIAAAGGDAFAANQAGWMSINGHGSRVNTKFGFALFEKSANGGHPQGYSNMAHELKWGWHVDQHRRGNLAVFYYYLKAVETGYPNAYGYLADCYRLGIGVNRDNHARFMWMFRELKRRLEVRKQKLGKKSTK